jgi:hypothetical protein
MDRDQILQLLRDELKIQVSVQTDSGFYNKGYTIKVELLLGDETVCEHSDSLTVETRDTSEQWRSTL